MEPLSSMYFVTAEAAIGSSAKTCGQRRRKELYHHRSLFTVRVSANEGTERVYIHVSNRITPGNLIIQMIMGEKERERERLIARH